MVKRPLKYTEFGRHLNNADMFQPKWATISHKKYTGDRQRFDIVCNDEPAEMET